MADEEGSVKVVITAEDQRALDSGAYHLISSEAAEDLADRGGVTILDVRSPQEYGDGHLRDSLNMRYDSFDQLPPELEGLDRDAPVLAYCRTGNRARKTCAQLINNGFTNVYNMDKGILDWAGVTVAW